MNFKKFIEKRNLLVGFFFLVFLLNNTLPTSAQSPVPTPQPQKPSAITGPFSFFLPFIERVINTDLTIDAMDITQAVQTASNTVPLIAGRSTEVRVYAKTNANPSVGGVSVQLNAYRGGVKLAGSPVTSGFQTVSTSWTRDNLASSFNIPIPAGWASGTVTIEAIVNPNQAVPENNYTNNSLSMIRTFNSMPALNVTVVPIRYTHTDGRTYPPLTDYTYLRLELMKIYPISTLNITVHTPINFNEDLGCPSDSCGSWDDLLSTVYTMRSSENHPPDQVYYGVVPVRNGTVIWFNGGVAGLGYVGVRASVGLAYEAHWSGNYALPGGEVGAHEIGHNMGRLHSPCNVSGGDSQYPYPLGNIGQYGLDLNPLTVYSPSVPDIMGYCNNRWISDYTYKGLYDDQKQFAVLAPAAPAANSMLVRAKIDTTGTVTLRPAYNFMAAPDTTPAKSEYSVEFLDTTGQVIASQPVALLQAEEPGVQVKAISSLVPLPGKPFASYRLVQNGSPLAQKSIAASQALAVTTPPKVVLAGGETILSWGPAQVPSLVRYTTDGGQTWTALGVDVSTGQLSLDPASLPAGSLHFEIIPADSTANTLTLDWQNNK